MAQRSFVLEQAAANYALALAVPPEKIQTWDAGLWRGPRLLAPIAVDAFIEYAVARGMRRAMVVRGNNRFRGGRSHQLEEARGGGFEPPIPFGNWISNPAPYRAGPSPQLRRLRVRCR